MLKKSLLIGLGMVGLVLGAIGAAIPLLPCFPFLLLAAFCFAKSSEKLDTWFKGTKLYKNNLESYVKGEGMSTRTKVKIMTLVTILMTIGFIMMNEVIVGRAILFVVWLFHMWYFIFKVKTNNGDLEND